MVRKTRKHSKTEVHTIPQLRRLFENIEEFVDSRVQKHEAKDKLSKELQKEWKRIFMKELDKKHADAFVEDRMKSKRVLRHTIKKGGFHPLAGGFHPLVGGAQPLAGAPLDYSTRQGLYLAPNSIPVNGQLPLSNAQGIQNGLQNGGGYGSYVDYVNSGFWNPEDSSTYDPIEGQQPWPQPYASTGSNEVKGLMKGGKFKKSRKVRGGSALLTQAFTRPFGSDAPPSILQDMQSMAYGQQMGPSPNQVQRPIAEVHSMYKVPLF